MKAQTFLEWSEKRQNKLFIRRVRYTEVRGEMKKLIDLLFKDLDKIILSCPLADNEKLEYEQIKVIFKQDFDLFKRAEFDEMVEFTEHMQKTMDNLALQSWTQATKLDFDHISFNDWWSLRKVDYYGKINIAPISEVINEKQ